MPPIKGRAEWPATDSFPVMVRHRVRKVKICQQERSGPRGGRAPVCGQARLMSSHGLNRTLTASSNERFAREVMEYSFFVGSIANPS